MLALKGEKCKSKALGIVLSVLNLGTLAMNLTAEFNVISRL